MVLCCLAKPERDIPAGQGSALHHSLLFIREPVTIHTLGLPCPQVHRTPCPTHLWDLCLQKLTSLPEEQLGKSLCFVPACWEEGLGG